MLRQMRYFIAVVETGSFSEAGERCHISQSAVSQQIKALEDELQTPLLDRRGRRFEVTPAGQYLYQRARRQVAELDSILREVQRIGRDEHQRLRVGVLTGFSDRVVQAAVHAFVSGHPNVQVSAVTGTHEALFRQVLDGQLELVVNDQRRALSDQFVNHLLGEQPLYALIRQDLAGDRAALSLEDLKDQVCLLVTPPEQRADEAGYWRDVAGVVSDIAFVDSVDAARVNAAAGAGWLPCDRDMPCGAGMALIPLMCAEAPLTRRMYAFWPESVDSPLQWEFSEALLGAF